MFEMYDRPPCISGGIFQTVVVISRGFFLASNLVSANQMIWMLTVETETISFPLY